MLRPFVLHSLAPSTHISFFHYGILSWAHLHLSTTKSSVLMSTTSCWFLVFVWVVWWLPLMLARPEEQLGDGCSAKKCGNLTISQPFWIPDWKTGRSCGSLDFVVSCNKTENIPILRSSGSTGFAILSISYESRSLHVVDVYNEEGFNDSSGCHFPRWNTSGKLAPPFKVSHANLNLILYNCTKTLAHRDRALVEMRCVDGTNTFVRTGGHSDETGNYGDYALEGCNATVVPVMSSSGKANASDYERLISGGFLLTWEWDDPKPLSAPLPLPTPAPALFVWVWLLPLALVAADQQEGEGCLDKRCGSLTVSHPFWISDNHEGRSCGSLDFVVDCNNNNPVLRSSGSTGFAILNISYESRGLRVVDLYKEEDINDSHFPRWNTSGKLATPFKVSHANLNLIFYNCTKPLAHQDRALVEMRCVDGTNTFVRTGGHSDETGNYVDYALQGCNATVVPVMSWSGKANASHYKQLIKDGFLLTWDLPPLPAPERRRCIAADAARKRSSHKWTGRGPPVSASLLRRETEEFDICHGLVPAAAPATPDSPPSEFEEGSPSDTWTLSTTATSPYTPVVVDEDGFEIYDPAAFEGSVTCEDFIPEEVLGAVTGAIAARSVEEVEHDAKHRRREVDIDQLLLEQGLEQDRLHHEQEAAKAREKGKSIVIYVDSDSDEE
ncbi:putative serine/threonine-protein kinase [Hordeum vulgare]|nr:putative serine/threonine-protein kinase [Hordeum vulgare]